MPPSVPIDRATYARPSFSPAINALATLLLLAGLITITEIFHDSNAKPLQWIEAPERALELIATRSLDAEFSYSQVPGWERQLYKLINGDADHEQDEVRRWYEELAAEEGADLAARDHLYLAILRAETRDIAKLREQLTTWRGRKAPYPLYARVIEAAYLGAALDRGAVHAMLASLAQTVPAGWFRDTLAIRIAARGGDSAQRAAAEKHVKTRAMRLLARTRLSIALEGFIIITAAVSLFSLLVIRRHTFSDPLRIGAAILPPPWSGRVAAVVVLRGVVLGGLATLSLSSWVDHFSDTVESVVLYFPLILLAYWYLLRPFRRGFYDSFGIRLLPNSGLRCVQWVIVLVALQLLMDTPIACLPQSLGSSGHWTEWFDAAFAWGTGWQVTDSFTGSVIIAPIFEETIFRGLLFASLRRRWGFWLSGLLSAVVFAFVHGYGLAGFLSTFTCGFLWAWAYERSGSLLPSMAAHALSNLLVCFGVLALLG